MSPAASWATVALTVAVAIGLTPFVLLTIERLSGAYLIRWVNGAALSWDPAHDDDPAQAAKQGRVVGTHSPGKSEVRR